MSRNEEKLKRLNYANELLLLISKHGRRFFYSEKFDRVARFELDARGRIWFVDDHSDKRIYIAKTGFGSRWRGFTGGGTLRSLIEAIRDYVMNGKTMARGYIGAPYTFQEGNHWGYDETALGSVRVKAFELPMFSVTAPSANSELSS